MCPKVSKIGLPNQTSIIWHILDNISGLGAYFSKPIFALKPWVQAGRFEYHETHNLNNFFCAFKGVGTELKNHKIARHSAGNALKFPIFFLLHSYYPYVCANSTPWSNSKIRFFWDTLIPIYVLQKIRISMLTLQTVNGISGIQKDNPGYKNSICKFHFIYLQILRTLGEFKWYIWFICSYCLTFIFLMASGEYIHWFDCKICLWMRTGLFSVDVWFFHCLFSNFVKTKLNSSIILFDYSVCHNPSQYDPPE